MWTLQHNCSPLVNLPAQALHDSDGETSHGSNTTPQIKILLYITL